MSVDAKKSRYAGAGHYDRDVFRGTRPRGIQTLPGILEHTVERGQRLDLLALHYYNDDRLWWRILDANPSISYAGELSLDEHEGTKILIPGDGR
ncbi:MAG: hypothetical protein RIT81_47095 [Deltaproteobacteria bacterium]